VILVALFGVAITDQGFGSPLGRGLLLLILIAAWLWLPRLTSRTALAAAAAVVVAGIAALPVAAALDAQKPWIDYYSWGLGGKPTHSERFDWNHRYGPINWPRSGRTLLMVKSAQPHYWKAETLDYFDGLRWSHTGSGDSSPIGAELPPVLDPRWTEKIQVSVRELRSDLVIGAGTILGSSGDVGGYAESSDGTARIVGNPLQEGDTYSVSAYVPDPSANRMKAAPDDWDGEFRRYLAFSLPHPGETALRTPPRTEASGRPIYENVVTLPFRSEVAESDTRAQIKEIRKSPYRRMYNLARTLAKGQATTYDVVSNTEKWLQRHLTYSERVPSHQYPLPAFLFEDKQGYCQQFSGAMALMLRMNGIPARVAGGFAPGIYEQSTKEYRVRDLDAHSWVEVYFVGIGWVPFDPTPTTSPAGSQSTGDGSASAARGGGADRTASLEGPRQNEVSSLAGPGALGDNGNGIGLWVLPLALVVLVLLGGAGLVVYSLLHARRHHRAEVVDAQLAELEAALRRMGHDVKPDTTLTALERRLTRLVGPAAGRYAALLRERRYGPNGARGPGRSDRAALRRELGAAGGHLGRIRALLALPPRRSAA
jgi:transglutaminase-like putative cysteine protease